MTAINCLCTIVACGTLVFGAANDRSSLAAESEPSKRPGREQVHSGDRQVDRVVPKQSSQIVKPKTVHELLPGLPHPLQSARSGVIVAGGDVAALARTVSSKSATKVGLTAEKHLDVEIPHKSSSLVPLGAARRRAPGPGNIGGSAIVTLKGAAVINGTGMKHRP